MNQNKYIYILLCFCLSSTIVSANITGVVQDVNTSAVLDNVFIYIYNSTYNTTTYTDVNGLYELNVSSPSGNLYSLIYNKTGYYNASAGNVWLVDGDVFNVDLYSNSFIMPHTITGYIYYVINLTNDAILPGATISVTKDGNTTSAISNAAGIYTIYLTSEGVYTYSISKYGYVSRSGSITIHYGTIIDWTLYLNEYPDLYTFSGRVYDERNRTGITGAMVSVTSSAFSYGVSSNSSGYYSMPIPADGYYSIHASKLNYTDLNMDVYIVHNDILNISLMPEGYVIVGLHTYNPNGTGIYSTLPNGTGFDSILRSDGRCLDRNCNAEDVIGWLTAYINSFWWLTFMGVLYKAWVLP